MLSLEILALVDLSRTSGTVTSSMSSMASSGSIASFLISQMLCSTQHAPSTTGKSWSLTSVLFCRQDHLPFSLAKASLAAFWTSAIFSLKACCVQVKCCWEPAYAHISEHALWIHHALDCDRVHDVLWFLSVCLLLKIRGDADLGSNEWVLQTSRTSLWQAQRLFSIVFFPGQLRSSIRCISSRMCLFPFGMLFLNSSSGKSALLHSSHQAVERFFTHSRRCGAAVGFALFFLSLVLLSLLLFLLLKQQQRGYDLFQPAGLSHRPFLVPAITSIAAAARNFRKAVRPFPSPLTLQITTTHLVECSLENFTSINRGQIRVFRRRNQLLHLSEMGCTESIRRNA
nr:GTP-binding nuclear protein Ran-1 [Ipomoea batatas]